VPDVVNPHVCNPPVVTAFQAMSMTAKSHIAVTPPGLA
jgi:hypothetical protein